MTAAGFWEALEGASKADPQYRFDRQQLLRQAEHKAQAFYGAMLADAPRLSQRGIRVTIQDRTVSFRKGPLEVLAVIFGTNNGNEVRLASPVIEYLKLTPSSEELHIDEDVFEPAGRWLGLSIDAADRNRAALSVLDLS